YSSVEGGKIETILTEVWTISNSGKTLTVFKTHKSAKADLLDGNENWSMKGVYEKERGTVADAIGRGVKFEQELSWKEVLAKAKAEHRSIFVDCYATWCGPCKAMDKDVYPNLRVGGSLNGRFIAVKMQMDATLKDSEEVKGWYADAKALMNQYKI